MAKGRITEESIKTCSGQFDLESIFTLTMSRMGLRDMENLSQCTNLATLDLSHNRLQKIEGLDELQKLTRLVLADNDIDHLENLEALSSLEVLKLQGNNISNLDEVQCLSGLPALRRLFFQTRDAGGVVDPDESNPICNHPAYRATIRRMLPALQFLDGESLDLADLAAARGGDEPEELAALTSEPTPWFSAEDLRLAGAPGEETPLPSESGFEEALTDCKRLSARAQAMIEEYSALG